MVGILKICIISFAGILTGSSYAIFAHKKHIKLEDGILTYIGLTFVGCLLGVGIVGWIWRG